MAAVKNFGQCAKARSGNLAEMMTAIAVVKFVHKFRIMIINYKKLWLILVPAAAVIPE